MDDKNCKLTHTECHAIDIPPGNERRSNLTNCVFDSIGVTATGPTVLIESFTEVINSSFNNHQGNVLSIQVSKARLSIQSISFNNNSCTDPRTGKDGMLCEGSNISFVGVDITTQITIHSAYIVSFEDSIISRFGINIAASYIYITNTNILNNNFLSFNATISLIVNNLTCKNNDKNNYLQFNGRTNESKIEILSSSFNSSPIQISNACLVNITNSQFTQCIGNKNGGAVNIDNQIESAIIQYTSSTHLSPGTISTLDTRVHKPYMLSCGLFI